MIGVQDGVLVCVRFWFGVYGGQDGVGIEGQGRLGSWARVEGQIYSGLVVGLQVGGRGAGRGRGSGVGGRGRGRGRGARIMVGARGRGSKVRRRGLWVGSGVGGRGSGGVGGRWGSGVAILDSG